MVSSCRLSSRLAIEMALSQASLGAYSLPALISIKATAIISASAAMARPRLLRGLPPTASIEASFDKGFPRSRRKAWKAVCIIL